jgi:2-C-methyl-D-erythritol 4-phosphate cytidylyltransferase
MSLPNENADAACLGSQASAETESVVADPIFMPETLHTPEFLTGTRKFDALMQDAAQLEGRLDKKPKTAAIILAGGTGERFGREGGKQLIEIAGKPVLTWSAEAFDAVGDIGLIVVVAPADRREEYLRRAIDPFPFVTPVVMAEAGEIRQVSAFNGLEAVPNDFEFVVIHDGARPLITPELITHTLNTLKGNLDADGAVVGHPSVDTLKIVQDGMITGTPDRRAFWNAQTPQCFRTGVYRRAHMSALADGFVGTDDSSLVERMGGRVLMVEGKRDNIKLTVPEDYLLLASAVKNITDEIIHSDNRL